MTEFRSAASPTIEDIIRRESSETPSKRSRFCDTSRRSRSTLPRETFDFVTRHRVTTSPNPSKLPCRARTTARVMLVTFSDTSFYIAIRAPTYLVHARVYTLAIRRAFPLRYFLALAYTREATSFLPERGAETRPGHYNAAHCANTRLRRASLNRED